MIALIALVLMILSTGCASDGDTVRVSAVGKATESADSVRLKFAIEFNGVRSSGEGVMDLETGDQRVASHVEGSDDGSISLLVDGQGFIGPLHEPKSGPAWIRLPRHDDANAEVVANQPAFDDLVDSLKKSAATLNETGTGKVHGATTTTYSFTLDEISEEDGEDLFSYFRPAKGTMDVDDDGRLRRLVVHPSKRGADQDPVPSLWSIELWDFGVDVDLEAPTARVVDFDDPAANALTKAIFGDSLTPDDEEIEDLENPELAGEFAKVASGVWENVTWEVWRAPTTDGRICQTFEVQPNPFADGEALPDDIAHNGFGAACLPMPKLGSWSADVVSMLSSYDDRYWYTEGIAASGVVALDVTYKDGSTERVPVDSASGVFVMFKKSRPKIKEIRPDAGGRADLRCTLDEDEFLICSGSSR